MHFVGEAWGDHSNVLSLKADSCQPVSGEGCNRAGNFTIQGDPFPEESGGAINLIVLNKNGNWPLSLVWDPTTKMLNGTSVDKTYTAAFSLVTKIELDAACLKHAVSENLKILPLLYSACFQIFLPDNTLFRWLNHSLMIGNAKCVNFRCSISSYQ